MNGIQGMGEINMRSFRKLISILLAAALISIGMVPVAAQDELVTCDSDLIVQLYIAEYYFNFAGLRAQLMDLGSYFNFASAGTLTEVDLSVFDKGQYTPLFAQLETLMGEDGMMESPMMDETLVTDLMTLLPMSPDDMATMMGDAMPAEALLMPATTMDEPAECQALRAELTHFFMAVALRDV